MFRCENTRCGTMVKLRQPENKIVTEQRRKAYENVIRRGKEKGKLKLTEGHETVTEIRVCPKCYQALTGKTPLQSKPTKHPIVIDTHPQRRKDRYNKGKKWRNPRAGNQDKRPERKKPIVEIVNPLKTAKE